MKEITLYGGVKPYIWQLELHNFISGLIKSNTKDYIITIKASRQVYGKSAAAKAELLRFSLQNKTINAYVSPTLKLAKKMFEEIEKECSDLISKKNATDLSIIFKNGSKINFFSAEQSDTLRGFTVTGILIIDEAAFIKDETYSELISPWTIVHKALTLIISTPKFKQGFFYQYYLNGLVQNNRYKTFDWIYDYPPDENSELLKDKKENIPRQKYNSEYLGKFLDGEGSVFGDFKSCIQDFELDPNSYKEIYLGLDLGTGSGQDYTVLTGVNENGDMCFSWSTNELTPLKQIEEINKILKNPKIKGIKIEENGIGKVYLDLIKQLKNKVKLTTFTSTNSSKRELVEQFQVALENNKVTIFNDKDLINQGINSDKSYIITIMFNYSFELNLIHQN